MKNISRRDAYHLWSCLSQDEQKNMVQNWAGSPGAKNLLTHWDEYDDPVLLWKACFGEREFKNGSFRIWLTEIKKALEQFLTIRQVEQEGFRSQLLLLERIKSTAPLPFLKKSLEKLERQLLGATRRDARQIRALYEFYLLKQQVSLYRFGERKSFSVRLLDYKIQCDYLEYMELALQVANDKKVAKLSEPEASIDPETIKKIQTSPHVETNPLLRIYLIFYDLLMEKELDHKALQSLVLEHTHLADRSTFTNFFLLLLNYTTRRTREETGPESLFAICRFVPEAIEKKYFDVDGYLQQTIFLILMRAASLVATSKEIRHWYKSYLPRIRENDREAAKVYAEAFIAYHEERFEKVHAKMKIITQKSVPPTLALNYKFILVESSLFLSDLVRAENEMRNIQLWLKRNNSLAPDVIGRVEHRHKLLQEYIHVWGTDAEPSFWEHLDGLELPFTTRYFFDNIRRKK